MAYDSEEAIYNVDALHNISPRLAQRWEELINNGVSKSPSKVEVIESVRVRTSDEYELAFELGIWRYKDSEWIDIGYRFMWYHITPDYPKGKKCPHRGQARIPIDVSKGYSIVEHKLKAMAKIEGWYKSQPEAV